MTDDDENETETASKRKVRNSSQEEREREAVIEAERLRSMQTTRRMAKTEEYLYDKSQDAYWDTVTGTLHVARAVDASIPMDYWRVSITDGSPSGSRGRPSKGKETAVKPSFDLTRIEVDKFVEGATWWPGKPQIVEDLFVSNDGPRSSPGIRMFNTYRGPDAVEPGPARAALWVEHVKELWPTPEEHEYFFDYCAHMIQRPEEKCNVAIVLSGAQGIGKDAALVPVRRAVGGANVHGIDPDALFSSYKPWFESVMLVIDEVRPHKDEYRAAALYNILKPIIAAPPFTLPLEQKFEKVRYVMNLVRVFITTNEWLSMYIPDEDRRMFILHSTLKREWASYAYFRKLFDWFDAGGNLEVSRFLAARDISGFNPAASPAKSAAWEEVTSSWNNVSSEIDDALDRLGYPETLLASEIINGTFEEERELRKIIQKSRKLMHNMGEAGYSMIRCEKYSVDERFEKNINGRRIRSRTAFIKKTIAAGKSQQELLSIVGRHCSDKG